MEQGSWIGRNGKALVAVGVLAAVPVVAWMNDGRWTAPRKPPCEATATLAREAADNSPRARFTGDRVLNVGAAVPLQGAEEWLPAGSSACRAPVVMSASGRETLLWRVDPAPEMGQGQVLVRGVVGEENAHRLRDLR